MSSQGEEINSNLFEDYNLLKMNLKTLNDKIENYENRGKVYKKYGKVAASGLVISSGLIALYAMAQRLGWLSSYSCLPIHNSPIRFESSKIPEEYSNPYSCKYALRQIPKHSHWGKKHLLDYRWHHELSYDGKYHCRLKS